MNKKIIYLILFSLLIAVLLCACDPKTPPKTDDPIIDDGWKEIKSVTAADVYTKMLGGFTTIATDFSKSSLKSSPKVSVDGKLKFSANGNVFWVTLKGNYNNLAPADLMLALEISTEEDSYEDNVLALYIYKEKLNIALGETKFSMTLKADAWNGFFPFDMSLDSSDDVQKVALLLAATLELKDETIAGKQRMNGTVEELNYEFQINLPKSLKKIHDYLKLNTDESYQDVLDKFGMIIINIFGVTMEDIAAGEFPTSSVKVNFTTADRKISAFSFNLDVDEYDAGETMLFAGNGLKLDLELIKFTTSKKDNVSIDFVVNTEKQQEFIYYVDNVFNISADVVKKIEGVDKNYKMCITAKIFQDNAEENFVFIEYKNSSDKVERAIYVYNNIGYYYNIVGDKLECVYSFAFDLTQTAYDIVNNQLNGTAQLNWLNMISYFIGSLKINDDEVRLFVTENFYEYVAYNFEDAIDYFDALYQENIREIDEFIEFYNFLLSNTSVIHIDYDKNILSIYPDDDMNIGLMIYNLEHAVPQKTLTPVVQEGGGE